MAAALMNKPKSEMTPEELDKREEEEFNTGPLSVLTQSVKNNTQVRASKNLNTLKTYILAKLFPGKYKYIYFFTLPEINLN